MRRIRERRAGRGLPRRVGLGWLAVIVIAAGREAPAQIVPPRDGTVAILAWRGPPETATTPERYRQLAEAGFTHALTPFSSAAAAAAALEVASGAGIRLFISCPELGADPEATAARFREHPGLGGFDLADEPSPAAFPELANLARRLTAADPRAVCYVNLLPTYAAPGQLGGESYERYVERFLDQVPVRILSFDHYPITTSGIREDYFENLEVASRAAITRRLPLWAFVLSVAHHPYPIPTAAHLRFQAFCNLAYGAKCIQYFTYWTPFPGTWDFHQGPIETDGAETPTYALVRSLNRRIAELAPIFADGSVVSVGHLGGPLPRGTRPYEPREGDPAVRLEEGRILVSLLRGANLDYCVVVNRDLEDDARLVFVAGRGRDHTDLTDPARPVPVAIEQAVEVAPASIRIWGWQRSAGESPLPSGALDRRGDGPSGGPE